MAPPASVPLRQPSRLWFRRLRLRLRLRLRGDRTPRHFRARSCACASTDDARDEASAREILIELNRTPAPEKDLSLASTSSSSSSIEDTGDDFVVRVSNAREESENRTRDFLSTTYISGGAGDGENERERLAGLAGGDEEREAFEMFSRDLRLKLEAFESYARRTLCGREKEVRLLLLALFSQQHVLLLGPAGIGKSLLASSMLSILSEEGKGSTFRRQLNRFTTPEELFGPLSVRELQRDSYVRLTDKYMPSATVAFLDEAFKASSSILNSLLSILNERTFCENGACTSLEKVPLLMCIFSSNEIPHPNDTSVHALFDRILVRVPMRPLQGEQLKEMLTMYDNVSDEKGSGGGGGGGGGGDNGSLPLHQVTREDILKVKDYSIEYVTVPPSVFVLLKKLRVYLRTALEPPVVVSDRRLVHIVQLLQVCAFLNGRRFVNRVDCLLLEYMVWDHEVRHMSQVRRFLQNELLAINANVDVGDLIGQSTTTTIDFEVEANALDSQKLLTRRCDKIFRETTEHYEGAIYMKGDTMSARYTAYRRGKLKQRSRELKTTAKTTGNGEEGKRRTTPLEAKINGLAEELEKLIMDKSEFMDTQGVCNSLRSHQFLSDDYVSQLVCEVEPKLMKSWRFHTEMLEELYLLRVCLERALEPEALVKLFPNKLATFSKNWRTAL